MRRTAPLLAALLLCATGLACAAQRALLVGVSRYPDLPERRLQGPANDVRLMADSLGALGWSPAQVQVLAERGDALPTRANILQALARLAETSRRGDWVLLYFSGHGAQVPVSAGGEALEEIFLARDATAWEARAAGLNGAVRDKELAEAVRRIRAQGAHVWAIFDTCHAADMLRGPVQPWRFLGAAELRLPVPGVRARRVPSALRSAATKPVAGLGHYIGFFAAGRDEGTLEETLPDPFRSGHASTFGVFTWELARSLRVDGAASLSAVAARIGTAYRQRPFPTPEFVGDLASGVPRP